MSELPIEKLLPRANYSIYKLVSMAAARALELSEGKKCLAENCTSEKFTTMALEEILQGKIEMKGVAEIQGREGPTPEPEKAPEEEDGD